MMGDTPSSKLIGRDVINDKDQTIGRIDDILIGSNDKARAAVISVGGFIGIGAKTPGGAIRSADARAQRLEVNDHAKWRQGIVEIHAGVQLAVMRP